jgi:hypothetical protein
MASQRQKMARKYNFLQVCPNLSQVGVFNDDEKSGNDQ